MVDQNKELADLFKSFNEATKKLQLSHILLQQKVEELTKQLEEKNRELERKKYISMLGEMATAIAHDFRNPLGGIELYAQLLKRELSNDNQKVQIIDKILNAISYLNNLIMNILNFSGNISLQKKTVDIHKIINDVLVEIFNSRDVQNISANKDYKFNDMVNLDPLLFQRVCENIIVNAIDVMPQGGSLYISTNIHYLNGKTHVKISFADTGKGLSEKALKNLFTPFFTEKHKGIGLGLAISHKIVEAHNGKIEASNSSNGGAVFDIFLPV